METIKNKNNKIKVSFFLPSFDGGGAERIILNIVKTIDKEKFYPTLVLGKKEGVFLKKMPPDVPIVDFKTRNIVFLLFKFIKYINKEKPDVFVSSFPHINVISIIAKIFSRTETKLVICEHTNFSQLVKFNSISFRKIIARFFLSPLRKIFYPKADFIVCVSKGIVDDLLKNNIAREDKMRVIYNSVMGKEVLKASLETCSELWFKENKKIPVILSVGRLMKAKDYPTALKAFSLVLNEVKSRFAILGDGKDIEELKNICEGLGISKNVAFLGFQENPYKYMKNSSVFILSSIREGFSTVLIEAMACGLPVVSTNCQSGPNEIINNGENGFLVPTRDFESLARAIVRLLKNSTLREGFSRQGKKTAEYFSVENSTDEYEKVFLGVMGY